MKIVSFVLLLAILFTGCSNSNEAIDAAMRLRNNLNNGNGCSYICDISADYGNEIYAFTLSCSIDAEGSMLFEVTKPESLKGICGKVDPAGGKLTFDQEILAFPTIADDLLTPVSSPWVLYKALCGGYISSAGKKNDGYLFKIDDTYLAHSMRIDVFTDNNSIPVSAEFLWEGRRILSLSIDDFIIL